MRDGVVLVSVLLVVVHQGEARRFAASELGLQTVYDTTALLGAEALRQLALQLLLGDVRPLRVHDVNHLLPPSLHLPSASGSAAGSS